MTTNSDGSVNRPLKPTAGDLQIQQRPLGLLGAAGLSLAASTLGALCTTGAIGATSVADGVLARQAEALNFIPVMLAFGFAILLIALPAGLILGIPSLLALQVFIRRWPAVATLVMAIIGTLAGGIMHHYLDSNTALSDLEAAITMGCGATVGGLHALVLSWRNQRSKAVLVRSVILTLLVTPPVSLTAHHVIVNIEGRQSLSCTNPVNIVNAALAPRALLAVTGGGDQQDRVFASIPSWQRDSENPARITATTDIFVNGQRAIQINDEALAPQSILTDLGMKSPVQYRCVDLYRGPYADLVHRVTKPVKVFVNQPRRPLDNEFIDLTGTP